MANFPTSFDTLSNPSGSDYTDNPSLSSQLSTLNDIAELVEAKIGIDSSAVTTSFDYKLSGVTGSDKAASVAGTETLTNKTLATPTITAGVAATSFDMNGQKLILDADADTSITADTNDQIDIEIAGADDFQFTANDFTALSGSVISTNTINETTGGSGVTIDGVLLKDDKVVIDSGERLGVDGSDNTTIGKNSVRATRFVAITPVEVLSTDPLDTTWTDLDVTANTSARAFAVALFAFIASATTAGRGAFARKNGTALVRGSLTRVARNISTIVSGIGTRTVELDSDQKFEWSVDDIDVSSLKLVIDGYWEYVD